MSLPFKVGKLYKMRENYFFKPEWIKNTNQFGYYSQQNAYGGSYPTVSSFQEQNTPVEPFAFIEGTQMVLVRMKWNVSEKTFQMSPRSDYNGISFQSSETSLNKLITIEAEIPVVEFIRDLELIL